MTLLVAGHDTTATGLSGALERLTRDPGVLARAVHAAEASAAGDADGDEYLDAVAKGETLRGASGGVRRRPHPDRRQSTSPATACPPGDGGPGIGLVHADARLPDPERFDPDRMVGATLSPTTWLPFGGGARRCLGATFAMAEMRVVLREVLLRTELVTTTAPGERQRVKHVILTPHRGGRIWSRDCGGRDPSRGERFNARNSTHVRIVS